MDNRVADANYFDYLRYFAATVSHWCSELSVLYLHCSHVVRRASIIEKDLSDAFPVKIILVETFLALAFPALPSTFPHPTSFVLLVLLANVYVLQV